MILDYMLRLALLLPMVGGLAWGSLWLWKRLGMGLPGNAASERHVRIVEFASLGTGTKLAVVEFGGRKLLLGLTRSSISMITSDNRASDDQESADEV